MNKFRVVAKVTSHTPAGTPVTRLMGVCRAENARAAIQKMRDAMQTIRVHRIRAALEY